MGIVRHPRAMVVLLTLWVSTAVIAAALAQTTPPAAAPKVQPVEDKYVPPPQPLHLVDGHWTPYQPPKPPEGAKVHTVVPGDCLWNLAKSYYGDPYLWPTIWDANRWVTYSHWIYPGDPLVIPPKPTVVAEGGPASVPEAAPEVVEAPPPPPAVVEKAPPPPAAPAGPVLVPAADAQELACSPQLLESFDPAPLKIMGVEMPEKTLQAEYDIVYMSGGADMGIKPGAEYTVIRPIGRVQHPDDKKLEAVFVRRLGRVRVLAVQDVTATAEITLSCSAIHLGDFLVPYHEMPAPMIERIPLRELATPYPGKTVGVVVVVSDPRINLAGTGDIVGIDLSSHTGLTIGDRVLFWRPGPGSAPRRVLAQGVVISTNGGGSMVKIIEAVVEVERGDKIEIL